MTQLLKNQFSKLNLFVCYRYPQIFLGAKTFASYRRRPKRADVQESEDPKPYRKRHKSFPLFVNNSVPLAPKLKSRPRQIFDYFLVLDFEATCDSPVTVVPQVFINDFNRQVFAKQCWILKFRFLK